MKNKDQKANPMTEKQLSNPSDELQKIILSATRLGIEMDEAEALQWLAAIAVAKNEDEKNIVFDVESGVFGHRVSMLDFNPAELTHFRRIGKIVGFENQPGVVETALALSGSSAQSKIQAYPGDADYFERINIRAETFQSACQILGRIMQQKAKDTLRSQTYQLIEVKMGSYSCQVIRDGKTMEKGQPICWLPEQVNNGAISAEKADGSPIEILWDEAVQDPGWCKLDWVMVDPLRQGLVNVSNMLDVTWEAPDGKIIPLDGYLDPYFQEVYLDAESIPVFSKLAKQVGSDALESYIAQLENEAKKYITKDINYAKAAKRMYNVFRLSGKFDAAVYLRELFDEPATVLYQSWSLIRTIDDCFQPNSGISNADLLSQTDQLMITVVGLLGKERSVSVRVIRELVQLRDFIAEGQFDSEQPAEIAGARAELIQFVNDYFYDKLSRMPVIQAYMEELKAAD